MRPPDDELEAVVDETSPAERKRRRWPLLLAVVVLAAAVASVALLSRREDPAPDLTCNERDLFDPENANLFRAPLRRTSTRSSRTPGCFRT